MNENTTLFDVSKVTDKCVRETLEACIEALAERGYNPINQIVGYILSGDPSYITSYNGARSLVRKLERDEILEELVSNYVKDKLDE